MNRKEKAVYNNIELAILIASTLDSGFTSKEEYAEAVLDNYIHLEDGREKVLLEELLDELYDRGLGTEEEDILDVMKEIIHHL